MDENPLISIIIPVFNREKLIVRTLESVQNQTYSSWECLIVDDGSTDNTLNVIDSFIDRDKRFQIISHHHVGNANVLRNIGINKAKGEYIAMLDSDDEFMANHLSRRLAKIKEWGCDGIYGSYYLYNGESKELKFARNLKESENFLDYLLGKDGCAVVPSQFYSKETVLKVLWDENLKRHQDYDFSYRYSLKNRFVADSKPTVVVNWLKGEKRKVDFLSTKQFLIKHISAIHPDVLGFYSMNMLMKAIQYKAGKSIIDFYKEILLNNSQNMSYTVRVLSKKPILLYLWSYLRGYI